MKKIILIIGLAVGNVGGMFKRGPSQKKSTSSTPKASTKINPSAKSSLASRAKTAAQRFIERSNEQIKKPVEAIQNAVKKINPFRSKTSSVELTRVTKIGEAKEVKPGFNDPLRHQQQPTKLSTAQNPLKAEQQKIIERKDEHGKVLSKTEIESSATEFKTRTTETTFNPHNPELKIQELIEITNHNGTKSKITITYRQNGMPKSKKTIPDINHPENEIIQRPNSNNGWI